MRTLFFFIFIILGQSYSYGNASNMHWIEAITTNADEWGSKVIIDSHNNVYVYGSFGRGRGGDTLILGTDTIFNIGDDQIILVKYTSSGILKWAKSIGGNNINTGQFCDNCEDAYGIHYDSINGAIYLSGLITGNVQFDSIWVSGYRDNFLAQLDTLGNFHWVKIFNCPIDVDGIKRVITTDLLNNVYCGYNSGNSFTLDNLTYDPGSYIFKFGSSGAFISAKNVGSNVIITNLTFYNDSLIMQGFSQSKDFSIDTLTINSSRKYNIFICKLNLAGNLSWYKLIKSDQNNLQSYNHCLDNMGNICILGMFYDTVTIGDSVFLSNGSTDIFYVILDISGNYLAIKQLHSTSNAWPIDVCNAPSGFYFCAKINGQVQIGDITLELGSTIAVFRINNTGELIGMDTFNYHGYPNSILYDKNYYYLLSVIWDPSIIYGFVFPYIDGWDLFIAKFDAITGMPSPKMGTSKLFIYANPTTGLCNIEIPEEFEHEPQLTLFVYDQTGRLLKQAEIVMEEDRVKLNLEALAKGMYTAIITNGKKRYSGKIIFQ
jgi:hypothetical protein